MIGPYITLRFIKYVDINAALCFRDVIYSLEGDSDAVPDFKNTGT